MGIDVCGHNITYQRKLAGDYAGTGSDFQYPIIRFYFFFCSIEQEVRIGFGLVYLRWIVWHGMMLVLRYVLRV
jgi:hypothetical protein